MSKIVYLRIAGKCLLILLCLFILGMVFSVLSILGVAAVNRWDDAPGGGLALIAVWLMSEISALICGIILCLDIWKGKSGISHGKVKRMMLRCWCFIGATSLGASSFILLVSGPSSFRGKLLSTSTAVLYVSLSIFCFGFQLGKLIWKELHFLNAVEYESKPA